MMLADQPIPRPRLSLPTTMLVVDDDDAILRKVRRESLRTTNLGVLVADNLSDAVRIMESGIEIGALLVDLNFRADTQDEERCLHTGLDFLEYVAQRHRAVPKYVLSVDATDQHSRADAAQRGIHVQNWFDKMSPDSSQLAAWVKIERDLIKSALLSDSTLREKLSDGSDLADLFRDDRVAEQVRTAIRYPRVTYIQKLEGRRAITVRRPIEVLCWEREGRYFARASQIPLLQDGESDDPVDAIDELADLLREEFMSLADSSSGLIGYAEYIYKVLCEHLDTPAPMAAP